MVDSSAKMTQPERCLLSKQRWGSDTVHCHPVRVAKSQVACRQWPQLRAGCAGQRGGGAPTALCSGGGPGNSTTTLTCNPALVCLSARDPSPNQRGPILSGLLFRFQGLHQPFKGLASYPPVSRLTNEPGLVSGCGQRAKVDRAKTILNDQHVLLARRSLKRQTPYLKPNLNKDFTKHRLLDRSNYLQAPTRQDEFVVGSSARHQGSCPCYLSHVGLLLSQLPLLDFFISCPGGRWCWASPDSTCMAA